MQPVKGLNIDTRPLEQPEGTYPHGKNGVQYDVEGAIINEPGFRKMAAVTPYTINGVIETDDKPILFSTDDTNSAIGYFNPVTELYEPIFDDSTEPYKLGFKKDNFITGQAQRNYKSQIVCAFTDKVEFPKYINCDAPQVTRLEDWNLFPYYRSPTITTTIEVGGRLYPGTYYASVKYLRNDGTTTPSTEVSLGKTVQGSNLDTFSDKAFAVTITNADPSYDYVIVSIISKVKGITKAVELEPVPINANGTVLVVYTGDNISQDVALEEILTPPAVYSKVQMIAQLNDALYIADLEKEPDVNDMQQYANLIGIEWESKLLDAVSPPDSHINGEEKGFMHEEVYALYIRYRLTKGGKSKAFTIPGNTPLPAHLLASNEANIGGFTGSVFQVEDTITTFNVSTLSGNTGVWQNDNERYPDTIDFDSSALGGRNLRNQKVLHHKLPSIRWCKQNLYSGETEYGRTKLDILGLKVTNIIIPPKYVGIIDGYEILYAKRTTGNMTNYGQGLLLHMSVPRQFNSQPSSATQLYTTGSNWHSRVVTAGNSSYNPDRDLNLRLDTMRIHAFDILLNRPGIKPTFISAQLKHRLTGLRPSSLYQDGDDGNNGGNTCTVHLLDFTTNDNQVTPIVPTRLARGIVNGGQLLTNNVSVQNFVNKRHETTFGGLLQGANWPINVGNTGWMTHTASGNPTDSNVLSDFVETHLVNLKAIKDDLYTNFYSQTLVTAGNAKDLTDTTAIFGGDVYVCPYTFHTYGRHESADSWGGGNLSYGGKKVVHRFICESVSNIHLRYEIPGNVYSKWYPNTPLLYGDNGTAYPEFWDRNIEPNQFGYTKDLNALNDLITTTIFSPFREELTLFPFRIHRGGKLGRQTKFRSWRTFLPLDYYETQKNMGRMKHLEGFEDKLYIHYENALFATQDKTKLGTDQIGVTLGTGDIFQFEPQPILPAKLGYAGTQHQLACVNTPAGYVFVDSKQGELYIMRGGKIESINPGLNRLLRELLLGPGINPFVGSGITIGWDQKFKRLLITVKGESEFTLSYSIKANNWAFFHSYIPDFYFHTREQLWSIKNNRIYKHHDGTPGLYYTDDTNPFFIDVVFRGDSDMILETVNWITEILNQTVDNASSDDEWKTLTHITIWNSQQHTGRITLKDKFQDLQYETSRRTEGVWSFNDFRNILKDRGLQFLQDILNDYALIPGSDDPNKGWYEKELIEDKYFVVRFEFDNTSKKQIILHSVNVEASKSDR